MKFKILLIAVLCFSLAGCSLIRGRSAEVASREPVAEGESYEQDPEYVKYQNEVRRKIGKTLEDISRSPEAGKVALEFELSSSGRLLRYRVDGSKTNAPQELIDEAINALRLSYPFEPFPGKLKRKYAKLFFTITVYRK